MTQPKRNDQRRAGVLPIPITSAREAYARGEFSTVVAAIDSLPADSVSVEARLLRARALLRLRRATDVVEQLAPLLEAITDVDEACTARMLYASAVARIPGGAARGLALLDDLANAARQQRAHSAIRAEIEYYRGLASWSLYELDEADRRAAYAENAPLDVLSVRATELRGFVAIARAGEPGANAALHYANALKLFQRAKRAYAACRGRDVDLATQILLQISSLEQTLRSANVEGTHRSPTGRRLPGSVFGPATATGARLMMLANDAWLHALDGNDVIAFRMIREAERVASETGMAWHVWALAVRATIAAAFGEGASARTHAEEAVAMASNVDWNSTCDEERLGLLQLAEVCALVDAPSSSEILARYDALDKTMDGTRLLRDRGRDPRLVAWDAYARGLVMRNRGDVAGALQQLTTAADYFRTAGYLWRQVQALIELAATSPAARHHGAFPIDEAAALVGRHFPRSFLARRFGHWSRAYVDPVVSALTPAQRDVLRHLLEGRTMHEIATVSARSYKTVRTHVTALHRAFGTQREHQILAECGRRGIGAPSWTGHADIPRARREKRGA